MDETASERGGRARTAVRLALENWDSSELERIEATEKLLQQAAADLQEAQYRVRAGISGNNSQLCATVSDLKRDVAQLMRMVDAGAAFYRGLAVRLGESAPTYTANGMMTDGSGLGNRGIEG